MRIVINDNVNLQNWNDILENSIYSSPFQSPDFFNLYRSIANFSANVFAVERNGIYISLVLVTVQKEKGKSSYFSRRGIIYGGPLVIQGEEQSLLLLLKTVHSFYKKKLIYLEIRNNFDYNPICLVFEKANWKYVPRLNVKINIENTSLEGILSKMKYNRRREINLSYKEGALVCVAENNSDVEKVYKILYDLYVKKVKLPLPDLSYFQKMFNSKIGKVFVVSHDNTVIGGAFALYDTKAIYTLYYAGLRDYHKKIFPTHLAIMGVIEFAIKNKLKMIDFMGAGKPGEKYGVRDYKQQFGGDIVKYGRYLKVNRPMLYVIGKIGVKAYGWVKSKS